MKKIHLHLAASLFWVTPTLIGAEVLDRKTVVITPRKIATGAQARGLRGTPQVIEVFFREGSARLSRSARRALTALQIPKGARIQIMGHANRSGGYGYNRSLSRQRAMAVLEYLKVRQPEATYRYRSFGERRPTYSNRTSSGYNLNRRVAIRVIPPN